MKIKKLLSIFIVFVFLICSNQDFLCAFENKSLALTSALDGNNMFVKEYTDMMHTKTLRFVFEFVDGKLVFRYVIVRTNITQKEIKIDKENIEFDKSIVNRKGYDIEYFIKRLGKELRCNYDGTKVVISANARGGMRWGQEDSDDDQPEAGSADSSRSDVLLDQLLSDMRSEETMDGIIELLDRMSVAQLKRLWLGMGLFNNRLINEYEVDENKLEKSLIELMRIDRTLRYKIFQVISSEEENWENLDFWVKLVAVELLMEIESEDAKILLERLRGRELLERIRERIDWAILIIQDRDNVNLEEEATYICPISHELLRDPVTASDFHTYERDQIEHWMLEHNTSPFTQEILTTVILKKDIVLKKFIERYVNKKIKSRRVNEYYKKLILAATMSGMVSLSVVIVSPNAKSNFYFMMLFFISVFFLLYSYIMNEKNGHPHARGQSYLFNNLIRKNMKSERKKFSSEIRFIKRKAIMEGLAGLIIVQQSGMKFANATIKDDYLILTHRMLRVLQIIRENFGKEYFEKIVDDLLFHETEEQKRGGVIYHDEVLQMPQQSDFKIFIENIVVAIESLQNINKVLLQRIALAKILKTKNQARLDFKYLSKVVFAV